MTKPTKPTGFTCQSCHAPMGRPHRWCQACIKAARAKLQDKPYGGMAMRILAIDECPDEDSKQHEIFLANGSAKARN